jgi:hypothetical protein
MFYHNACGGRKILGYTSLRDAEAAILGTKRR